MSDESEERQHPRFKVGDRVRIVHGREMGHSGVIVQILPGKRLRGRYEIELSSAGRAYCAESDLVLDNA